MPDGSWLTVPVRHDSTHGLISKVKIDYRRDWRRKHVRTLRLHYGSAADPIVELLEGRQPTLLQTLNIACLKVLLADVGTRAVRQPAARKMAYCLTDGHSNRASYMLAEIVRQRGGTIYLSGPSGRNYLDERPFRRRDIEIRYFDWLEAENPCSLSRLIRV